ncbi:arylformamidase [Qipengyuania sp. DGS5-3]|uniref:arylformamidase n=1 Tax=Qipengyuania sp. DGS5-3 TaxID=3349632 RepID=UPI0036D3EC01
MSSPRIWDISQRIHEAIPMWPGEPPVEVKRNVSIGPDCPVNVGAISLPLHTGTHGDAPLHYDADGIASDECALDPYIGPCVVLDARHAGASVTEADLDWDAIAGASRVLIRTYHRFPHDAWDSDFTAIDAGVIARLREQGVQLIGTDAPSLDPETCKTMDAHHEVRAGDMRILEGLVLDDVSPGKYELIALPLAIAGADASPVRAILRELAS